MNQPRESGCVPWLRRKVQACGHQPLHPSITRDRPGRCPGLGTAPFGRPNARGLPHPEGVGLAGEQVRFRGRCVGRKRHSLRAQMNSVLLCKFDIAAMASNLAAGARWKLSGAFCVRSPKPSPDPRFEALAGMSQGYRGLRHGDPCSAWTQPQRGHGLHGCWCPGAWFPPDVDCPLPPTPPCRRRRSWLLGADKSLRPGERATPWVDRGRATGRVT